ncbi:acyl-CoA N-acyltransferase [Irpex rosettiformis]|uniref:Acyl-CoA N-acyltransferase n=1 Tax=Irpex rosettiformis TaxID=378272 RepID=A0ACB8TXG2_9APHY|nr:acyl-CoA N-acyltransferase [Irpex rosettiformis]
MFETNRLILRRYRPTDEEFFLGLFDEYPVLLGITLDYITPNQDAYKTRLEYMKRCLLFVVVEDKATKTAIGFTLLNQTSGTLNRDAEVGIALTQGRWGQGYGTEILNWLIGYSFEGLSLNRLSLTVWSSNTSAIRLYERIGFKHEGRIREGAWKEGRFVDKVLMGLLAREYRERQVKEARESDGPENTFLYEKNRLLKTVVFVKRKLRNVDYAVRIVPHLHCGRLMGSDDDPSVPRTYSGNRIVAHHFASWDTDAAH